MGIYVNASFSVGTRREDACAEIVALANHLGAPVHADWSQVESAVFARPGDDPKEVERRLLMILDAQPKPRRDG